MAEYIAEGVRFSGNEAQAVRITDIKNEEPAGFSTVMCRGGSQGVGGRTREGAPLLTVGLLTSLGRSFLLLMTLSTMLSTIYCLARI